MNLTEEERLAIVEELGEVRTSIMEEIANRIDKPRAPLDEKEFTTVHFALLKRCPVQKAHRILKTEYEKGRLKFRKMSINGRVTCIWREVDD